MTAPPAIVRDITRPDGHTVTVVLHGSLDYDTADELLDRITGHLATHPGTRAVHVDCTDVDYCDSWGLSVLLMSQRVVAAAGARLQLDDLPPRLARVLELTGTLDHLGGTAGQRHRGRGDT
jgi:anti-anti-sigma factor